MFKKPIDILLVEDSPSDIRLTREAFRRSTLQSTLHIVEDGEQALDFLYRRDNFQEVPRPDLILLDLNLPNIDGREVLSIIKKNGDLCTIPVVILTTSSAQRDIIESYRRAANCYITKPGDFSSLLNVIRTIEHFWFSVAKLPQA